MSETNYNNFLFQGKQRELLELLVQDYGKEYAQDVLWNLMTSATNGDTCTEKQTVKFWVDKLQDIPGSTLLENQDQDKKISYKLTDKEKEARCYLQSYIRKGIPIPIEDLINYSSPASKSPNFIDVNEFTRVERLRYFTNILDKLEQAEEQDLPSELLKYIYNESGIYALLASRKIVYIGSTTRSFQQRAREHYRGIQEYLKTGKSVLYAYSLFKPGDTIEFMPMLLANNVAYPKEQIPEHDLKTMELTFISLIQPKGNLAGTSQEFRY